MRDKRFVAAHRGGPLLKTQHQQLMQWSVTCVEHVLPLLKAEPDQRIISALLIAHEWIKENIKTGAAMKASLSAHAAARESTDAVTVAIARAAGQCVATAHMADHSLGGAVYSLIAVKQAGGSVDKERDWQNEQLPPDICELVLSTRKTKEGFKELTA